MVERETNWQVEDIIDGHIYNLNMYGTRLEEILLPDELDELFNDKSPMDWAKEWAEKGEIYLVASLFTLSQGSVIGTSDKGRLLSLAH